MAITNIIPLITLVIVASGTVICYKAKSLSDKIIYKHGFWAFGLFSISWLISIIQAYVLSAQLQRYAISLGINHIIQTLMLIGVIVLVFGFYKSFRNSKTR